jgi:hypothetical protein
MHSCEHGRSSTSIENCLPSSGPPSAAAALSIRILRVLVGAAELRQPRERSRPRAARAAQGLAGVKRLAKYQMWSERGSWKDEREMREGLKKAAASEAVKAARTMLVRLSPGLGLMLQGQGSR